MQGVVGVFDDARVAVSAIGDLKRRRFGDMTVFMPAPDHEVEDAIDSGPSIVRRFTLIGGLCGLTFGYWIPIWVSRYWPLVVGGKAFGSWIPYTIIGFELTVLIGGLSTVAGLFFAARLPKVTSAIGYDARFSGSHYGIWIACAPEKAQDVQAALKRAGAVEVRNEA